MGLLKVLFVILIFLFPVAEIGRFQFSNGVAFSINDVFLITVIISWVSYLALNKKQIEGNTLRKPLLIFICIAFISLILNVSHLSIVNFFVSFLYLLRWVMYASLFFIVKGFDKKFKNKIVYFLLFSGLIVTIAGYLQYFLYPSLKTLFYLGWDEHLYRMFSSFLDPNFAGCFFVLFFLFILGLIYNSFRSKLPIRSTGLSVLGFFVLIAVYLTYSRSAFIMLVLSTVTFLLLIGKKKMIIVSIIGLFLIILIIPKSFKTEGTNLFRVTSSKERIASFQIGLKIFQSSPILGVGFNAYRYVQNQKFGLNNDIWQVTHSGAGTDNSFLFIMATTGIIGFGAYIFLLFKIIMLAKENLKNNVFSIVLISSLVGLIFNSFFINSLFYVFILEWIWIIASLTENN
jgi:O-antigen ligase